MGDCAPQFGIRLSQDHVLLSRAIPGHHEQSGANSKHLRPRGTRDMGTRGQKAQGAGYSSRIFRKSPAQYAANGHDAAVDHGWLVFGFWPGFLHLWGCNGAGTKVNLVPWGPEGVPNSISHQDYCGY
ncbi:hypothetical protein CGRA01v4_13631 [Colletotrichum graminicola]|nr:hypothetical protein CGRA01v4_13631 [Colletotrichum graminicola]